jgi:hypothetical protein
MAIRALENALPLCFEPEPAQASECEYRMAAHILFLRLANVRPVVPSPAPRIDAAAGANKLPLIEEQGL